VASSISAYATEDSIGLQLSSLSKHLPVTFAQFATTITSPAFRASDFERMVKRRTEAIRQSKGNPAGVASRVFSPVVYGREHPLGAVTTEASLGAIKIDDCKKLAATALKPGGARLFVVGDLTEAQIRKLFDEPALATWRGAVPRAAAAGAAKPLAGRIFFVDVPGSAQSVVTMVHAGPRRDAADYFATTLMAQVFGGSFSSRINMNLRENKGYSYGARGGFQYTKSHSWFSASASVRTDSTYQTILEINSDVRALATAQRPIEAAELEREQRGMVLGLPGQFATGQQALGNYRRLVYYGLPMDYYGKLAANVERVNLATVKDAASKHLRPSDAIYIVVGDGSAMMKVREGTTDVPMLASGKPVTLRQALETMVETKHLGPGALISIDADGQVISR
jgi:zinc protease